MHRLLALVVPTLCAVHLYGGPVTGCTASLTVDGTTYTSFGIESSPTGCSINGTFGSLLTTGYTVTVTASTQSDPVIDFGMNFSGSTDPVVTLMISTPYTGGPFSTITTAGSGILTDSDFSGSASALPQSGGDIELVKVNGVTVSTVSPLNPGCSVSGTPGFTQPACGPATSQQTDGSFPGTGTLELDAAFILSAGDSYNLTGSTSFNSTPEPATGVLLGAGLVAIAALARRRLQTAAMALSRSSNV
jgi:hypothetical protein